MPRGTLHIDPIHIIVILQPIIKSFDGVQHLFSPTSKNECWREVAEETAHVNVERRWRNPRVGGWTVLRLRATKSAGHVSTLENHMDDVGACITCHGGTRVCIMCTSPVDSRREQNSCTWWGEGGNCFLSKVPDKRKGQVTTCTVTRYNDIGGLEPQSFNQVPVPSEHINQHSRESVLSIEGGSRGELIVQAECPLKHSGTFFDIICSNQSQLSTGTCRSHLKQIRKDIQE